METNTAGQLKLIHIPSAEDEQKNEQIQPDLVEISILDDDHANSSDTMTDGDDGQEWADNDHGMKRVKVCTMNPIAFTLNTVRYTNSLAPCGSIRAQPSVSATSLQTEQRLC